MSRILVNLRGCNGAGKSTIPMAMMDDPKMYIEWGTVDGKFRKLLTIFPTYGWLALGTYLNKTGGMDTFPNNKTTRIALKKALRKFPEYNVIMEGVIASTIKSTYAELFSKAQIQYPELVVIILSLLPPIEVCLERIQQRNGGKSINEEAVAGKWKTVDRNVLYFKEQGFISLRVNSAKIRKERMLPAFLKTVNKYNIEEDIDV